MTSVESRVDVNSAGKMATKRTADGQQVIPSTSGLKCGIKTEPVDLTSENDGMECTNSPLPKDGVCFERFKDSFDPESSAARFGGIFFPRSTFPVKLWDLLKEGKSSTFVKWSNCGMCVLLDTRFVEEKIQQYFPGEFGDNKLRNFCRQMRVYDFNEVTGKDPNWGRFSNMISMAPYIRVFYHHFFRKDHLEDLGKIVRVRDVLPRGRSKPKNPKPRDILPGPTGAYFLGFPPSSLLNKAREDLQKLNDQPRPTSNSTFSSMLEQIGQQTVLSTGGLKVANSPSKIQENFCQSLLLKPIQRGHDSEKADLIGLKPISENTPSGNEHGVNFKKTPVPTASASSLNNDTPVSFSRLSVSSENVRSHQNNQSTSKKPEPRIHHQLFRNEENEQIPVDDQPTKSALVLVPCLRTNDTLLPLTYGSRLSDAGINFLRQCPDFRLFLERLRPKCCDRSQQCEDPSIPTHNKANNMDMYRNSDVKIAKLQRDGLTDHSYSEASDRSDNQNLSLGKKKDTDYVTVQVFESDDITGDSDSDSDVDGCSDDDMKDCDQPLKVALFSKKYSSDEKKDGKGESDSNGSSDDEMNKSEDGDSNGDYHRLGEGDRNDSSCSPNSLFVNWSSDESMEVNAIVIQPLKEELKKV